MTPEQLDAIQARADAATEGPWEHQPYGGQNQNGDYSGGEIFDADGEYVVSEISDKDGAFIAAARTDVPALLAYARDLEARVGREEALCGIAEAGGATVSTVTTAMVRAALTATEGQA